MHELERVCEIPGPTVAHRLESLEQRYHALSVRIEACERVKARAMGNPGTTAADVLQRELNSRMEHISHLPEDLGKARASRANLTNVEGAACNLVAIYRDVETLDDRHRSADVEAAVEQNLDDAIAVMPILMDDGLNAAMKKLHTKQ